MPYEAYHQGEMGYEFLKEIIHEDSSDVYRWIIIWCGTCSLLRTSIDCFKDEKIFGGRKFTDTKTKNVIIESFRKTYNEIKENEKDNEIYWNFLRCERDSIIHEFDVGANIDYRNEDGSEASAEKKTIFGVISNNLKPFLKMKLGKYEGEDPFVLLERSCSWVKSKIEYSLNNVGYNLDDKVNVFSLERK